MFQHNSRRTRALTSCRHYSCLTPTRDTFLLPKVFLPNKECVLRDFVGTPVVRRCATRSANGGLRPTAALQVSREAVDQRRARFRPAKVIPRNPRSTSNGNTGSTFELIVGPKQPPPAGEAPAGRIGSVDVSKRTNTSDPPFPPKATNLPSACLSKPPLSYNGRTVTVCIWSMPNPTGTIPPLPKLVSRPNCELRRTTISA